MKQEIFNDLIQQQLEISKKILIEKGQEYALGYDRLDHFKKSAFLMNCTVKQAVFNMLVKHLVSISDMVTSNQEFDQARWTEKITDAINYLLILKVVIEDNNHE